MTADADDEIPTDGEHRGVPLHAGQDAGRLEVVRGAIDVVLDEADDVARLVDRAGDHTFPPEARLFARAMIEAHWARAIEHRRPRPLVDMDWLRAITAGLGSRQWQDPVHYCSVFDAPKFQLGAPLPPRRLADRGQRINRTRR